MYLDMNRRKFIKSTGKAGLIMTLPIPFTAMESVEVSSFKIGMVADVHQDIIHDGYARLRYFMDDMKERKPDFIIQMGDFALPRKQNQPFLDIWNDFEGPSYHVLGNHDMRDMGFKREETMAWWQMEKRYYSFDQGGLHFIVLDGNDKNPKPWNGYDRYIGEEQMAWLAKDLKETDKPTIVFSHQSLENEEGVANREEIRAMFEKEEFAKETPKVIACFSGHHHIDFMKTINGIPYIQINSMSYTWVGGKYQKERFPPHIEKAYPTLKYTCPYRTPLYTVLTIDKQKGKLLIEGCNSHYIAPTPFEMGHPKSGTLTATISERDLVFKSKK